MDDFTTLSNRLRNRCPKVDFVLAQQFINDSWIDLQAKREWSWRRRNSVFSPPAQYIAGSASTNVGIGSPNLITGQNTVWTPSMVGQQIRVGGLMYPIYTIVAYLSPTSLLIDQPWSGPDVSGQAYQIFQCFFPTPQDFGYMYVAVSIKDSYRLWTNLTENDLALLDPQRTNQGQTYACVYKDYSAQFNGVIGPAIGVSNPVDPGPISTTSTGFSYVANATYLVQVVTGGPTGVATFQWLRIGQQFFTGPLTTSQYAQNLMDGVQVYWPQGVSYISGDLFVINCTAKTVTGSPRMELWPAPTLNNYLYPYIYIAKECDLTPDNPQLPPMVANRGDVLLEMGLVKCSEYPGPDSNNLNPYHDLRQAKWHYDRVRDMLIDMERNDEEIGVSNIDYEIYPYAPAPWMTGEWQQTHAPFLMG